MPEAWPPGRVLPGLLVECRPLLGQRRFLPGHLRIPPLNLERPGGQVAVPDVTVRRACGRSLQLRLAGQAGLELTELPEDLLLFVIGERLRRRL